MAKTNQENPVVEVAYSWVDKRNFIQDLFFHPQTAFDEFLSSQRIGGRELLSMHLSLSVAGPFFLFLRNTFLEFLSMVLEKEPFRIQNCFEGIFKVWSFYLAFIFIIRFLDIFRLYHKFWDRTKSFHPQPNWIFFVSFLPFSGSGVFFIFPAPWNLFLILIAFLYCLNISYLVMKTLSKMNRNEFFSLLLEFGIFMLFVSGISLLLYNIYRTIRS